MHRTFDSVARLSFSKNLIVYIGKDEFGQVVGTDFKLAIRDLNFSDAAFENGELIQNLTSNDFENISHKFQMSSSQTDLTCKKLTEDKDSVANAHNTIYKS